MTKILIIEDQIHAYKTIIGSLSGYDFLPKMNDFDLIKTQIQKNHNSASQCIARIIRENYAELRCIICDLNFNKQDYGGHDIIEEIINNIRIDEYPEYVKHIPIIVYTNHTTSQEHLDALKCGATVAISKNTSGKYLRAVVNRQVDNFSALCDKYILKRPYKIGLTFTGENKDDNIPHRPFVKEIANRLAFKYGVDSIFYDEFHSDKIHGLRADEKLNQVYEKQCDFIAVFLSKDYASEKNIWTGIEWKAVTEYAKTHSDKIILITLETFNTEEIDGITKWDIYKNEVNACAEFQDSLSQNKKDTLTKNLIEFLNKKIE